MNTKEEIIAHLREIMEMEGKAERGYEEIISSLKSEALRIFFKDLAREEEMHGKLVRELMDMLEKS